MTQALKYCISLMIGLSSLVPPGLGQSKVVSTIDPKGPLKPFAKTMLAVLKTDTGKIPLSIRLGDKLELVDWNGHNAMRRESTVMASDNKTIVRWEISICDAATLMPYYSEVRRADGLFLRRRFDGLTVSEVRTTANVFRSPRLPAGTSVDSVRTSYPIPQEAYDWIGGAGLLILLAERLHDGMRATVPVIAADTSVFAPCVTAPCAVKPLTFEVRGPLPINGLSGRTVECWKVFSPEQKFTFWISCQDPHLEQVTWPGRGGLFSMAPDTTR